VSGFSGEAALIDEVRQRLVRKFADLSEDHVSTAVTEAQARFADSKVRDFVPLLIERRVSGQLSRQGAALG
jgi:CRISPR/Cas system-associated exonuclease Cas4 (RecB family)